MLALFASKPYDSDFKDRKNFFSHITNTFVQAESESFNEDELVHLFWDLCKNGDLDKANASSFVTQSDLDHIYSQIKLITKDLFDAVSSQHITFQAWQNCFEVFGLDFVVDSSLDVYLLEANAYPDFKQTGSRLSGLVSRFFNNAVSRVLKTFVEPSLAINKIPFAQDNAELELVLEKTTFGN
ncbi:hypothetical protein BB561_001416 [Smittium simulii]|uniref:Tubulin-tyrosine ligase n=1 Tax=Smittium simulii TaxID=133385 RepID=A0A2T9YUX0_9FUNG|nr:hypothetical protein BB561_001416 [Smittium simulii]